MTEHTNLSIYSYGYPFPGVFNDWMEAINQFQYWDYQLQQAINDQLDRDCVAENNPLSVSRLVELKLRINAGLAGLVKEFLVPDDKTSFPLQVLKIIEYTRTVLNWCLEIKQRLNM